MKTASAYINNLLLARGLLRDGKALEFAHPSRGEGGKEQTMAHIINLVHDLILKRDVSVIVISRVRLLIVESATRNIANPSPTHCARSAQNRRAKPSHSRNFTHVMRTLRVSYRSPNRKSGPPALPSEPPNRLREVYETKCFD